MVDLAAVLERITGIPHTIDGPYLVCAESGGEPYLARWDETVLGPRPTEEEMATAGLAVAKDMAIACIDAEAERRRLLVITPGAGQAQEYAFTAAEAALAEQTPDPLDPAVFEFLEAERVAQAAVHGQVTLRSVAQVVAAEAAAWKAYGAAVKQVRRTAKERVGAAESPEAVQAIVDGLAWPQPV